MLTNPIEIDFESNEELRLITVSLYNIDGIYIQNKVVVKNPENVQLFTVDYITVPNVESNSFNFKFNTINADSLFNRSDISYLDYINFVNHVAFKYNFFRSYFSYGAAKDKINQLYAVDLNERAIVTLIKSEIQPKIKDNCEEAYQFMFVNICNAPRADNHKYYAFTDGFTVTVDYSKLSERLSSGETVVRKVVDAHEGIQYLHNVDLITDYDPITNQISTQHFKQIVPSINATLNFYDGEQCVAVSGTFYYPYFLRLHEIGLYYVKTALDRKLIDIHFLDGQIDLSNDYTYWDYYENSHKTLCEQHHSIALEARTKQKSQTAKPLIIKTYSHNLITHDTIELDSYSSIIIDEIASNTNLDLKIDVIITIPLVLRGDLKPSDLFELDELILNTTNSANGRFRIMNFNDTNKTNYSTNAVLDDFAKYDDDSLNSVKDDVDHMLTLFTVTSSQLKPTIIKYFTYYITYTNKRSFMYLIDNLSTFKEHCVISKYINYQSSYDINKLSLVIDNDSFMDIYNAYNDNYSVIAQTNVIQSNAKETVETFGLNYVELIKRIEKGVTQALQHYAFDVEMSCTMYHDLFEIAVKEMYKQFDIFQQAQFENSIANLQTPLQFKKVTTIRNPYFCKELSQIPNEAFTDESLKDMFGKYIPIAPRSEILKQFNKIDYKNDWWYDEDYSTQPFENYVGNYNLYDIVSYDNFKIKINDDLEIPAYDNFPKKDEINNYNKHIIISDIYQLNVNHLATYTTGNQPLCNINDLVNQEFYQLNLLPQFPISNLHLGIVLVDDSNGYITTEKVKDLPIASIVAGIPDIVFESKFVGVFDEVDNNVIGHYDTNFYYNADIFRSNSKYISSETNEPLTQVADLMETVIDDFDEEVLFTVNEVTVPTEYYLFIQLAKQHEILIHPQLSANDDYSNFISFEDYIQYFKDNYTTVSDYDLAQYNYVRIDSFIGLDFKIKRDKIEYVVEDRDYVPIAVGTLSNKKQIDNTTNNWIYFGDLNDENSDYIEDKLFNHDETLSDDYNYHYNLMLSRYTLDDEQLIYKYDDSELVLRLFDLKIIYDDVSKELQYQSQIIKAYAAMYHQAVENNDLPILANVIKNPTVYKFSDKYNKTNFMNAWNVNSDGINELVDSDVFEDDDLTDYGKYKLVKIIQYNRYEATSTTPYVVEFPKTKCFQTYNGSMSSNINHLNLLEYSTDDNGNDVVKYNTNEITLYMNNYTVYESAEKIVKAVDYDHRLLQYSASIKLKPCDLILLYVVGIMVKVNVRDLPRFAAMLYTFMQNYLQINADNLDDINILQIYEAIAPNDLILSNYALSDETKNILRNRISNTANYSDVEIDRLVVNDLVKQVHYFKRNCETIICGNLNLIGHKSEIHKQHQDSPLVGNQALIPTQKNISGKVINLNEINHKFRAVNYDNQYHKPKSLFLNRSYMPLLYQVINGLNTVLVDYTYGDATYYNWWFVTKYEPDLPYYNKLKDDDGTGGIEIERHNYVSIQTINWVICQEHNIGNHFEFTIKNHRFTIEAELYDTTPKYYTWKPLPHIYVIEEMGYPYWLLKFSITPTNVIREISALTTPARAIRETRFSTAKHNMFDSAKKQFSYYESPLDRGLLFRKDDIINPDLIDSVIGDRERGEVKTLAYNGLDVFLQANEPLDARTINFYYTAAKGAHIYPFFDQFQLFDDYIIDKTFELISDFYAYTSRGFFVIDPTGRNYGTDFDSFLRKLKEWEHKVADRFAKTFKISIVIPYDIQYYHIDRINVQKIFEKSLIIDEIIFTVRSKKEFDGFVKKWADESFGGKIGINITLSYFKDKDEGIDYVANKAQFLYNFRRVIIDSENLFAFKKEYLKYFS